jgi:hypothetical protein
MGSAHYFMVEFSRLKELVTDVCKESCNLIAVYQGF